MSISLQGIHFNVSFLASNLYTVYIVLAVKQVDMKQV